MKSAVKSGFCRSLVHGVAALLGLSGLLTVPAQATTECQRQALEARVVAVRAALEAQAKNIDQADGDGARSESVAQWLNWPNWGNWNNWPNWGNWGNWFNR